MVFFWHGNSASVRIQNPPKASKTLQKPSKHLEPDPTLDVALVCDSHDDRFLQTAQISLKRWWMFQISLKRLKSLMISLKRWWMFQISLKAWWFPQISLKRVKSLMNVPDFLKTLMNVPDFLKSLMISLKRLKSLMIVADFRRFLKMTNDVGPNASKTLKKAWKLLKIHQRFAQEGYTHEADEASW